MSKKPTSFTAHGVQAAHHEQAVLKKSLAAPWLSAQVPAEPKGGTPMISKTVRRSDIPSVGAGTHEGVVLPERAWFLVS